jgi:hypothetical protein
LRKRNPVFFLADIEASTPRATLLFPRIRVPVRNSARIQAFAYPVLAGGRCIMDDVTRVGTPAVAQFNYQIKNYDSTNRI